MTSDVTPEFSRVIRPSALSADGAKREFELEASPSECMSLAGRFGFLALDYFRASVRLRPVRGGRDFRLHGHIVAGLTQSCVVTLDPVTSEIDHEFDLLLHEETEEDDHLAESDEDFELFSGDAVDIGEIVSVELALSVDPYPRAPGVAVDAPGPAAAESEDARMAEQAEKAGRNRPFEILAALKRSK